MWLIIGPQISRADYGRASFLKNIFIYVFILHFANEFIFLKQQQQKR